MSTSRRFSPNTFYWALGIEDTCVYFNDGRSPLDEHILTAHDDNLEADFRHIHRLGARVLRYGLSWPRVCTKPGHYDWEIIDRAVEQAQKYDIHIIADLVHYGTPTWLTGAFTDPQYPQAIADFAAAVAQRYPETITSFTPLNEPVTTASFCGKRGIWPPYDSGWDGWVRNTIPMVQGVVSTINAIRQVQPDATIVHVEASTLVATRDAALEKERQLLEDIGWLPTDMIFGRVNETHPMWRWLLEHGADQSQLAALVENPPHIDILGVNYYPDITPRQLASDANGECVQICYNAGVEGLLEVLKGFGDRYQLPLMVTETSIEGDETKRAAWLKASRDAVRHAARSHDIRGYTWWPLFDFVDWSWANGGCNVEEFAVGITQSSTGGNGTAIKPSLGDPSRGKDAFFRRMGLLALSEEEGGNILRHETAGARCFREIARGENHV